jgi:hypothetical protein
VTIEARRDHETYKNDPGISKNPLNSFTDLGTSHSLIVVVFFGSVATPSGEMMCPRYSTFCSQKKHLDLLHKQLITPECL